MSVILHKGNKLKNRFLCFDGDIIVEPTQVKELLCNKIDTKTLKVTNITPDIQKINRLLDKSEQIIIKNNDNDLDYQWNIPQSYKDLNVVLYVYDIFKKYNFDKDEYTKRLNRIATELGIYKRLNLIPFIQTLIYIVDIFEKNSIIWGVGRGSSVSSYVLFLLKVHDIDSYAYSLDIADFLE